MAAGRASGVCPYCGFPVAGAAEAVVCPACRIPHHAECWQENGGCTTYGCAAGSEGGQDERQAAAESDSAPIPHPVRPRRAWTALAIILGSGLLLFIVSAYSLRHFPRPGPEGQQPAAAMPARSEAGDAKALAARRALAERQVEFDTEAFFRSIRAGDLELARLYLDAGMGPEARDSDGFTPLSAAAAAGQEKVAALLLDRGASANTRNYYRSSTALTYAAMEGHAGVARLLIERGAAVDTPTSEGVTALMYAAYRGHMAVATALLAAGADPQRRDKAGRGAADYARAGGHDSLALSLDQATRGQATR